MADAVFLDTVGLIALLNRDDEYHGPAAAIFPEIGRSQRPVVTTNLVLAEVGNGLARTALRNEVVWLIETLYREPCATVVCVTADQMVSGVELYRDRQDKLWGLVDCVSFALMRKMGIQDAFTADHHFEQAGFRCMLP